jgi:hypothetical protein
VEIYMTNIFIDKNDLIALRDDIDYLLQKGKQSFAVDVQQRIYESDDLNEKEQLVIKILNKKPGINKEEVVNLQDRYARITILHTLDGLIKKGLIISKRDKIKKRTYRLYVNYQNITYSVKEDLDAFKVYYCELLDNAVPIAKKLWLNSKKGGERFLEFYNLLRVLIGPYKYLCTMYITSVE